jgi:hypothetical protein
MQDRGVMGVVILLEPVTCRYVAKVEGLIFARS